MLLTELFSLKNSHWIFELKLGELSQVKTLNFWLILIYADTFIIGTDDAVTGKSATRKRFLTISCL